MLHIIGISNCDKIRDTKKWLDARGIEFEMIDVREQPLTLDEIKDLEYKVGLDVLMNSRSTTYRELGLKDQELDKAELLGVLHQNQVMIKRPVLVYENAVLVGYDEEAFEAFINENELTDS